MGAIAHADQSEEAVLLHRRGVVACEGVSDVRDFQTEKLVMFEQADARFARLREVPYGRRDDGTPIANTVLMPRNNGFLRIQAR